MHVILLVFAFVCAGVATFNPPVKINLVALSLAFYFASLLPLWAN